tara:strand:+ start:4889 stop:6886 length:1998 start_codon:yes stop_codon:yes gene_type:complete
MAIKLTQGADASIVTAATRAGLATTPGDYGKIFENVAKSYEKTMEASGQIWKDVATIGAAIGTELQKNAAEWNSAVDKIYDAGGTDTLVDDIYSLKDELKELGPFGGKFGDRQTRKKRSEILSKRNKIFAEIDGWGEALDQASLAAEANLIDGDLMGMDKFEFVTAIVASNTSNKITGRGNYAQVSRDKKTNKLMYTMYKADGTPAVDVNGNPMTMDLGDFKQLVADHGVDTDNVVANGLNDIFTGAENTGATYGGVFDEYQKGKTLTSLKNSFKKPIDVKRGMHANFGHDGASFKDELTSASSLSASLFSGFWGNLQGDIPAAGKKGELAQTGVLASIKDTDNSGGISQDEVNNQWAAFQGSILSGQTDVGKEMFIDWAANKMESAYKFGAKQYNKKNPPDGKEGEKNLGIPDYTYPKFGSGKIDAYDARTLKRRLTSGKAFDYEPTGKKGAPMRKYDFVDGQWYENYDFDKNEGTLIGSADDVVLNIFKTNHEAFQGLETEVERADITVDGSSKDEKTEQNLHKTIFDKMDINKDDGVSRSLNNYFVDANGNKLSNKRSTLQFMPYTTKAWNAEFQLKGGDLGGTGWLKGDDIRYNDIMLFNPQTGEVIKDESGNRMRFKIGDDMSGFDDGGDDEIKKLLEVLKQYNIVPPNINTEYADKEEK